MIQSSFGTSASMPRVVAVNNAEIARARALLTQLAEKTRGSRLTFWQKRQIGAMASRVAIRQKAKQKPILSQEQAMQLYQIIQG